MKNVPRHYEKFRKSYKQSAKHSKTTSYKFERLYRLLFQLNICYYVAYQRITQREGNMTKVRT